MRYYTSQLIKITLSAILFIFCINNAIVAQLNTTSINAPKVETRYQIQLAAYKNPQLIQLSNFNNVGHAITIEKSDNDIHRILIKDLYDEASAKTALAIVQAKGYKDAFYTTYKTEQVVSSSIETYTTEVPSINTNLQPISNNELDKSKNEVFLVELGSFESVNLLHNTAAIRSMGELFRQKVDGGERIYIGVFDDLALAQLTLKKVQAQGYNTAGLRKVERSKILNTNQQNAPIQNVSDNRNVQPTPIAAANVNVVNQAFEKMNFHIFKVDAYDPTISNSFVNTMLQGEQLSPSALAFFEKNVDNTLQYFGIGSFDITPNHTAYMMRTGKGSFHNDNNIYLYVYDQVNKKIVGKELISSVLTTTNTYSKIQTWITDANKDGILDLLIYNKSETTTPDGQYASKDELLGKVWTGSAYTVADIKDTSKLKEKLGVN